MHWDAIVVGAGPAGIAAAMAIHRGGGRVLLLDRKAFPRTKACAGMLSSAALVSSPFPVTSVICSVSTHLIWKKDHHEQLIHERNILTHRQQLDTYLYEQTTASGVSFRQIPGLLKLVDTGSLVRLTTNYRELLSARTLIGADGANSSIRRLMGLPSAARGAFSVEVNLSLPADAHELPALFDYDAVKGGYGWWFPKGETSNMGIAIMNGDSSSISTHLHTFVQTHGKNSAYIGRVRGAAIGAFGPSTCLGAGNILLCGDAAGLTDPVTGEGISHAFRSGKSAGLAAISAMTQGSALQHYQKRMEQQLSELMRRTTDGTKSYGLSAG